jgi:hypothetical protein
MAAKGKVTVHFMATTSGIAANRRKSVEFTGFYGKDARTVYAGRSPLMTFG